MRRPLRGAARARRAARARGAGRRPGCVRDRLVGPDRLGGGVALHNHHYGHADATGGQRDCRGGLCGHTGRRAHGSLRRSVRTTRARFITRGNPGGARALRCVSQRTGAGCRPSVARENARPRGWIGRQPGRAAPLRRLWLGLAQNAVRDGAACAALDGLPSIVSGWDGSLAPGNAVFRPSGCSASVTYPDAIRASGGVGPRWMWDAVALNLAYAAVQSVVGGHGKKKVHGTTGIARTAAWPRPQSHR